MPKINNITACLALLAGASGLAMTTQVLAEPPLEGTTWQLVRYDSDGSLTQANSTRQARLRFDNGNLSGNGGCNQLRGNYDLPERGISVKVGAMTMMACPDGMDQEQAVVSALDRSDSYGIEEGRLTMATKDGTRLLELIELKPFPLIGPTWALGVYNNGKQALVSALRDTGITLQLADDGKFSGSAGCNRYFGTFEQTGDGIAFGPVASTRRACPAPDGIMKQETRYLQALEAVSSYRIDIDKLELLKSDGKVAARYHAADPTKAE